jgi:hypothetical protein
LCAISALTVSVFVIKLVFLENGHQIEINDYNKNYWVIEFKFFTVSGYLVVLEVWMVGFTQ